MAEIPTPTPNSSSDDRPKADRRALRGRLVVDRSGKAPGRTTPKALLAALATHVVVIALLVRLVTLGHGLHDWFGLRPDAVTTQERVQFVATKPPEPEPPAVKPKPAAEPPAVQQPVATSPILPSVPTTGGGEVAIDPALIAAARGGDSTGVGGGNGKPRDFGINPLLIGLAPANSDPRVWAPGSGDGINIHRSDRQLMDSVIGWAIAAAADSLDSIARLYDANRKPADWTKRMKNGEKWGWDKTGLRLGKYTVPNALLALLPASIQKSMQGNPIEANRARSILLAREDINRFSSQAMGEADFRKAVRELREKKDRDYQKRSKTREAEKNQPPPKAAPPESDSPSAR